MKQQCKRHKWRVGARTDCIIIKHRHNPIIPTKQVIWCERCGKTIKANIYGNYELMKLKDGSQNVHIAKGVGNNE